MIGKEISHYKIIEKLGEGGMGEVYLAEDSKLDRRVALKFLRPEAIGDRTAKERFIGEAKAASAHNHRNITTIYEIDEWQGRDFICMEYVAGQTVKQKVKSAPLPLDEVIDISIQSSAALREAHEHDIVHRDIKSDNIMVTGKGEVKVMDFGLAKFKEKSTMTKTGTTLGTVSYMSPEQAKGEKEEALTWIERIFTDDILAPTQVKLFPEFDSLRDEPRFKALLKKMNFVVND